MGAEVYDVFNVDGPGRVFAVSWVGSGLGLCFRLSGLVAGSLGGLAIGVLLGGWSLWSGAWLGLTRMAGSPAWVVCFGDYDLWVLDGVGVLGFDGFMGRLWRGARRVCGLDWVRAASRVCMGCCCVMCWRFGRRVYRHGRRFGGRRGVRRVTGFEYSGEGWVASSSLNVALRAH